jgi:hypothetical protein
VKRVAGTILYKNALDGKPNCIQHWDQGEMRMNLRRSLANVSIRAIAICYAKGEISLGGGIRGTR